MRKTGDRTMYGIDKTSMPKGSAIMPFVPYLPNMDIPDRDGLGLQKVLEFMASDEPEAQAVRKEPYLLKGKFVHTERGNGVVTSVRLTRAADEKDQKVSSLTVKLLGNGEKYNAPASMIYLANNLTAKNCGSFAVELPWLTDRERARQAKLEDAKRRQEERISVKEQKEKDTQQARQDAENKKQQVSEEQASTSVRLYPVAYNGYLAMEAELPETMKFVKFKTLGFTKSKDYTYVLIPDLKTFNTVLAWLTANFTIDAKIVKTLNDIRQSFSTRGNKKFQVDQSPYKTLKNFFTTSHKPSAAAAGRRKAELKIYPIVINHSLILSVDLATNAIMHKWIGKAIPGCEKPTKWMEAGGMAIKFYAKKTDMARDIKTIKKEYIVENEEQCMEDFDDVFEKVKAMK
jgi:hypothetical protein